MISIGRKLFDEVDIPTESKIISEDAITKTLQRESSWSGRLMTKSQLAWVTKNGIKMCIYH